MNDREKFKILVVDDERSNIDALTHILKPKYSVLVAKNGRTAIEVANENVPDIILLDIIMPDMSGFEVLSELKDSKRTRGIPVIFITGRDSAEDEKRGFSLGAVDYITRPFHNSVVMARVRTHLQMVDYIRTIEQMAMIDTLTNIPNRRGFDERLTREWLLSAREKKPISILLIDLDHFKEYNDAYGHPQGDILLRAVAEIFDRVLKRPADFAARWGGDEFAVLLPNTDLNGALTVAEQIRSKVQSAVVRHADGSSSSVTVSIGVYSKKHGMNITTDDFIAGADKALYAAKTAGRNIVCA